MMAVFGSFLDSFVEISVLNVHVQNKLFGMREASVLNDVTVRFTGHS